MQISSCAAAHDPPLRILQVFRNASCQHRVNRDAYAIVSRSPVCACWVSVAVLCQACRVTAPCQPCQHCQPPWQAFWEKYSAKAERSHLVRGSRANCRVSRDSRVSRVRAKRRVSRVVPAVSCARAGSSRRVLSGGAFQTRVVSDCGIPVYLH